MKSMTVRIDDIMLEKLGVIAQNEGRSKNREICILIRDKIKEYEKEFGEIKCNAD